MIVLKEGSDIIMSKLVKEYGGVIFFYSIVIMGVLLLIIKNNNTYNLNDTNSSNNVSIAYNE